jgi:hypothetical protein
MENSFITKPCHLKSAIQDEPNIMDIPGNRYRNRTEIAILLNNKPQVHKREQSSSYPLLDP